MKKTKTTPKEYKAREAIKRLFQLYDMDWSIDFGFPKSVDDLVPALDKYRVLLLSRMNFDDDRYDDQFEMKDANGEVFRLWEFADALKCAIWQSGRAKKYVGSYWIDLRDEHETVGIVGINSHGLFVVRYPNSNTWGCREIDLPNMMSANAVEAFRLWDKARIEKWLKAVVEYDTKENLQALSETKEKAG